VKRMITRISTTPWIFLAAVVVASVGVAAERPSFLLIFTDDQGMNDVGCYGSEIPTPHIDSLARDGLRYESWYVAAPVCTPSRFGLLTGRYPNRSRDRLLGPLMFLEKSDRTRGIRVGETTVAAALGRSGYETALIGKWHLGHGDPSFLPTRHGFDRFYGHTGGCIDYFTKDYGIYPDWYRGEKHVREDGYATDLITREAVRYLASHGKEKPFFLYLAYNAPHFGKGWDREKRSVTNVLQGQKSYIEKFANISDEKRREFAAMTASLDDGVGKVLAALRENGLDRQTVVIFMTDNGGDPRYGGSNRPYRGRKAELFEGGVRVPCIVRWPGRIRPGSVTKQLGSALDVFPTLCRLAGVDTSRMGLDGVDLSRQWTTAELVERDLFFKNGPAGAFRRGPMKFLRSGTGKEMLFDLERDPGEKEDVGAADRETLEELRAGWEKVARTLKREG